MLWLNLNNLIAKYDLLGCSLTCRQCTDDVGLCECTTLLRPNGFVTCRLIRRLYHGWRFNDDWFSIDICNIQIRCIHHANTGFDTLLHGLNALLKTLHTKHFSIDQLLGCDRLQLSLYNLWCCSIASLLLALNQCGLRDHRFYM